MSILVLPSRTTSQADFQKSVDGRTQDTRIVRCQKHALIVHTSREGIIALNFDVYGRDFMGGTGDGRQDEFRIRIS